ncbi:MAG: 30S ribosomal protein S16 [Phycisphaeraceae bacterium]|nr:30S ribosomal protein S16 [Phycisphaeraceae bacterium]
MKRMGRTHRPFYRIGAVDSREPRDGKFIEQLGWYNPIEGDKTKQVELKTDRIKFWLDQGAQPSDTVKDLLGRQNLLPGKMKSEWEAKRATDRARVAKKKADEAAAAAAAAEPEAKTDAVSAE